ncbi:Hypothetical predicted protein [Pelobates cultripes]|uniref:C-type lectin domain-containing protein n=1 Tax=Pelobates cultripes TaxID=61616 RepID=A0AAD1WN96_PELCU|nr:Hypothetical predicted protein [Pelobates cultripes]
MFPFFRFFTYWIVLQLSYPVVSENPSICQVVQGVPGLNGRDGRDGEKGLKGDPGLPGQTGAQGLRGPIGPPGKVGPQGQKGNQGDKGINGIQGIKGEKGSSGAAGIQGAKGASGVPGIPGSAGAKGEKGDIGLKGATGAVGLQGAKGAQGASGPPGTSGAQGTPGAKGEKGSPDASMAINLTNLEKKIAALENKLASLQKVCYFEAGVVKSGNKIYVSNRKEGDFATAKASCEQLQGTLPSPQNSNENSAIFQIAKSFNKRVFLGITDIKVENNFVYLNGNKIGYKNWFSKQPDGGKNENCAEMIAESGLWNDRACNAKNIIVCEFNS